MLIIAKTKIECDTSWLKQLDFKGHDDQDLAGNVDAVSIKSNDGGIHSFYRNKPVENPDDFKFTKYYKLCSSLIDYFEFETTRIRIHKQDQVKLYLFIQMIIILMQKPMKILGLEQLQLNSKVMILFISLVLKALLNNLVLKKVKQCFLILI